MRKIAFSALLLLALGLTAAVCSLKKGNLPVIRNGKLTTRDAAWQQQLIRRQKLKNKAIALRDFAGANGMDTTVGFLIHMSIHSGSYRFFVYDLTSYTLLDSGLVTHGRCNERFLSQKRYGNTVGCGCTSLGRYKIGAKYHGRFGLAYKLHGLDRSNSNAFKRFVVLHSHSCVPSSDVPYPICQSDGCPTVSPGYLQRLSKMIDRTSQPIALEIIDE
ncbi:MAG TPA: murein L,D-transpeptidase catalytic domain family protein [Flavipsychrobacter sp.]|nr:murein L,D-transpeptidase catalytic domain family protein [Flavipsychrobacter sp.]